MPKGEFMLQLAINLGFSTAIIFLMAWILPGFEIEHIFETVIACLMIGFVNFLIFPILLILRIPIHFMSLFISSILVNILLVNVSTGLIDEYDVSSWITAIIVAILLSTVQLVSNAFTRDRRKLMG
jgi:putative membrane protein